MAQFYHPGTLPSEFRCNVSAITSDIIKLAKGLNVLIELKMAQKICVGIALGKKKISLQPDVVLRRSNINDQRKASFLHEIHIYFGARLPVELEARHSALHMPSSTVHASCYVTGKHLSSIWSKRKSDSAKFKKK